MVTDEERDYMYSVYAADPQARLNLGIRRRLAALLGNDRKKMELMSGLLFSLPGTPVLYFGDEIGMGDNVYLGDRNGVRTPMQWSSDRNGGFSRANPQRLYLPLIIDPEYHYEAVNVENQQNNPHSLLWWMKRLIALRKRHQAFGRGSLDFLQPDNRKILAFLRCYQDERILIVANLSRFVQCVELDLTPFTGMVPIEMFGRVTFPPIGQLPYLLTLGPHAFYWFTLEAPRVDELSVTVPQAQVPTVMVTGGWESLFQEEGKTALEAILPDYLKGRRWFGGKARPLRSTTISSVIPLPYAPSVAYMTAVVAGYTDGAPETYILPLAVAMGEHAEQVQKELPQAVVARVRAEQGEGVVYEALWDKSFCEALLGAIARRRRFKGTAGELVAFPTRAFRLLRSASEEPLESSLLKAEQSNTSIVYRNMFILKLFRRIATGVNPDLEVGRFLTEKVAFSHTPAVAGALEYRQDHGEPMTVAILHGLVPNQGDAWQYTLEALDHYFERALVHEVRQPPLPQNPLLALSEEALSPLVQETISSYLPTAQLLGQRTAELHIALASDAVDPHFAPEPFSILYQRSIYQTMRSLTAQSFPLLRQRLKGLPQTVRGEAQRVLDREQDVLKRFQAILGRKITAMRIRCHGDYHLGQVLYTGKDFVIIDFEGEPARPLSERRIKRSPLRDVAGMLRSFHYAAYTTLFNQEAEGVYASHPEALAFLEPWARFWYLWVSAVFLKTYCENASRASFLPRTREELQVLLDAYLLEKAVYELDYELNNRPDWVRVPLQGILQLLGAAG